MHDRARAEFEEALASNSTFTPATVMSGYTLTDQARFGWISDRNEDFEAALALADQAVEVNPGYGEIHNIISYACMTEPLKLLRELSG